MDEDFVDPKRARKKTRVSNMHHYKVNCLYAVLDLQLREFNDRFNEVNTDLLICAASLSPLDSFSQFDQSKLMKLSKFYPNEFSSWEYISLEQELDIYIDNIRNDERFSHLKNLGELARLLVETLRISPLFQSMRERYLSLVVKPFFELPIILLDLLCVHSHGVHSHLDVSSGKLLFLPYLWKAIYSPLL